MAANRQWTVSLHSTGKGNGSKQDVEAGGKQNGGGRGLPVAVAGGRPDVRAAVNRAISDHGAQPHEVAVIACGPESLVAEAELAAGEAGCAFHKESFGV